MNNLFEYSLKILDKNVITKNIREKIKFINKDYAQEICNIVKKLCELDYITFEEAIKFFIDFSKEFLELQIELEKTGKYKFDSFEKIKSKIYDNPNVMQKRYLYGLFFSQIFWINHYKILHFFKTEFANNLNKTGFLLDVPVGTGIFLAEFIKKNKFWNVKGYDLSESSILFTKKVLNEFNIKDIDIQKKNVFNINNEKYDLIICGELLEHLENPKKLLKKLKDLLKKNGKIFLTTAIWAASIDHIYLFKSAEDVRKMLKEVFIIEKELVLNVFSNKSPEDEKTPLNYAGILSMRE